MDIQIIDRQSPSGRKLHEIVLAQIEEVPGELTFELVGPDSYRDPTIDPTVLVACVSGINSFLTALIVGLLKIVELRRPAGMVAIETASGKKIQFPAGTPRSEVEFLIQKAEELDIERIKLS